MPEAATAAGRHVPTIAEMRRRMPTSVRPLVRPVRSCEVLSGKQPAAPLIPSAAFLLSVQKRKQSSPESGRSADSL
jgi:hypothetical protein